MRRLIARYRRGKHNHCLPAFGDAGREICGKKRGRKTRLNLCDKAQRVILESLVKVTNVTRGGDGSCEPVSTPTFISLSTILEFSSRFSGSCDLLYKIQFCEVEPFD